MAETNNLKLKAKSYKCRFLEPGIVKYDDLMVLIKPENLMAIANTFKGVPVIIDHATLNHENVDKLTCGYVSNVLKCEDGWAWADFLITEPEVLQLLESGYNISCSYTPTKFGVGGTYHAIGYDKEILEGQGKHIAIVEKPRYEDAMVLENSNNQINNKMTIFQFLRGSKEDANIEVKPLETSFIETSSGERVSVTDLLNSYDNAKKKAMKNEAEETDEDSDDIVNEMDVDGKKVKLEDLKNAYRKSLKNEAEEKEEEKNKDNEDEKKKEEDKDLENSMRAKTTSEDMEYFNSLKSAREKGMEHDDQSGVDSMYQSSESRLKTGSSCYGSSRK